MNGKYTRNAEWVENRQTREPYQLIKKPSGNNCNHDHQLSDKKYNLVEHGGGLFSKRQRYLVSSDPKLRLLRPSKPLRQVFSMKVL